jgi:hypothetical protein
MVISTLSAGGIGNIVLDNFKLAEKFHNTTLD